MIFLCLLYGKYVIWFFSKIVKEIAINVAISCSS